VRRTTALLPAFAVAAASAAPVGEVLARGVPRSPAEAADAAAAGLVLLVAARTLRPGGAASSRGRRGRQSIAVGLVMALLSALGTTTALLLVPLLPAGARTRRRPSPSRTSRTARDAMLAAIAVLVFRAGPPAAAGAIATTLAVAALLPSVRADRAEALRRSLGAGAAPPRRRGFLVPAGLAFATLAAAAFLFVALPRLAPAGAAAGSSRAPDAGSPRKEGGRRGRDATAAIPGRWIDVGDIGRLNRSFLPVLEVTVRRGGSPAEALDLGPLFRSGALERFDGVRWECPPEPGRAVADASDGRADGVVRLPSRRVPAGAEVVDQELTYFSGGVDSLFCLGLPVAVGGDPGESFLLCGRGEVRTAAPIRDGARYSVRSVVSGGDGAVVDAEVPGGARRAALLDVAPGHERAAALARAEIGRVRDGRERLRRLEALLARRCRYSLDIAPFGAETPVEAFLFETRCGHCELFASSAAVMLRAVGTPARIAVGFRGGAYDPVRARYRLRGADAHAWVEAHLDGEGWVSFDPTPSAPAADASDAAPAEGPPAGPASPGILRGLLSFDAEAQGRFFRGAGHAVFAAARTALFAQDGGVRLLPLAAAALLLAALAAARLRRSVPSCGPATAAAATVAPPEAWAVLLRRLAEGGVRRGPAETARELAARAVRAGAAPADGVARLAAAYEEERWGGRRPTDGDRAALRAAAEGISFPPAPAAR